MASASTSCACPICCDNYTSVLRKEISCKFCEYSTCTVCVKKYLCLSLNDPACMKCNVEWDQEYIDTILSKNFRINVF